MSKNQKSKSFWKEILEGEKMLTDKEAEEIEETVKRIRKERIFLRNKKH